MTTKEKRNAYARNYYHAHKEAIKASLKEYRQKNRERLIKISRDYYNSHKEEHRSYAKDYREKNRAKLYAAEKKWRDAHRNETIVYQRQYQKNNRARINELSRIAGQRYWEERRNDPLFFLPKRIRLRLYVALKRKKNQKTGSAVEALGCSISELKSHLESLFLPGMSWENYGYRGWHIDHLKPLSFFDLADPNQLAKACHYSNLQPLWRFDNQSKGGVRRRKVTL